LVAPDDCDTGEAAAFTASAVVLSVVAALASAVDVAAVLCVLVAALGGLPRFATLPLVPALLVPFAPEFVAAGVAVVDPAAGCELIFPFRPPGLLAGTGVCVWLETDAEVSAAGAACCGCGELVGTGEGAVGEAGVFVPSGAEDVASRSAANGESPSGPLSWLWVTGCERSGVDSETALRSDAILGTGELPEATKAYDCSSTPVLATAGPVARPPQVA
jgi:hypothetical protein